MFQMPSLLGHEFRIEERALLWDLSKKPNIAMFSCGSYCLHLVASFNIRRLLFNETKSPPG